MSVNLLSAESAAFEGDFARQASAFLGESESKISLALKALVPAVLGGFVQKGSTRAGAESLLTDLKGSEVDADLSNHPTTMFSGAGPSSLLEPGHRLLSNLFGEGLERLTDAVASISDMNRKAAASLMDMASPVMFSVLKKETNEEGLDGPGLMGMLSGQGRYLQEAMDSRLLKALGFTSAAAFLGGVAGKVAMGASAVTSAAGNAVARTATPMARALPWLIVAVAAIILISLMRFWVNRTGNSDMTAPAGGAVPMSEAGANAGGNVNVVTGNAMSNMAADAGAAAGAAVNAVSNAANTVTSNAAASAGTLAAGGGQVFFATNSARIGADGRKAISAAADSLKAQGGTLEVTGYTDKRGSMALNEALAKRRTKAVLTALMSAGLGANQVSMKPADTVEANAAAGSALSDQQARRVDIMYVKP